MKKYGTRKVFFVFYFFVPSLIPECYIKVSLSFHSMCLTFCVIGDCLLKIVHILVFSQITRRIVSRTHWNSFVLLRLVVLNFLTTTRFHSLAIRVTMYFLYVHLSIRRWPFIFKTYHDICPPFLLFTLSPCPSGWVVSIHMIIQRVGVFNLNIFQISCVEEDWMTEHQVMRKREYL